MRWLLSIAAVCALLTSSLIVVESANQTNEDYEWTVMMYVNGDNNLYAVLQQRVQQIASEGADNNVALAILYDGRGYGDTKLYYVDGNTLLEQEWPTESDMSSSDTINQFATKVMNEHPSEHYCLSITSNKGSGWQGVCWDDNGDQVMITMSELLDGLNEVTNNGNDKLDVIQIESCLCGNLELRYQLQSCCDYFIGYADCGMIGDIAYTNIISDLKNTPLMSPKEFTECVLEYYSAPKDNFYKVYGSMGVTDSEFLDDLIAAIDDLSLTLLAGVEEYRQAIFSALEQTRIYGELWDINYYIDPVQFLELLNIDNEEVQNAKNDVIELIETAVIEKKICEDSVSCGLNMYLPRVKIDYNYPLRYDDKLPALYEETLFAENTNWDEFLVALLELDDNTVPETPAIEGPNRGEVEVEHSYTFTSTDIEEDDLYYFIDWGDGNSSGWIGPYSSREELTLTHVWMQQDNYNIQAKVRDAMNSESNWGTLEVSMPKNKPINSASTAFLIGKISDIERNNDGDFRFLPIKVVEVIFSPEESVSVSLLDEFNGGFPCCGYIDINQFTGMLKENFICGYWQIE